MRFAWQCLPLFSVNYLVTNLCNAWLKKMQHNIFIFFYYSDNCTLSCHFNLFFLFILLVYFVLMWCDGTAGVGLSTSSGFGSDLSLWTGVLSWGAGRAGAHSSLPHCWPEQPVSNLLWNEERERTGPSQKHWPQGDGERSGRPTQNLNRSTSKGAVQSKFSWVQWLQSGAWRAFAEIKEWQTSIEKRERAGGRWGNKAMGERQTE